jgi:hypothetical protein
MTSLSQPTVLANRRGQGAIHLPGRRSEAVIQRHCVEIVRQRDDVSQILVIRLEIGTPIVPVPGRWGPYASFKEIDHDYSTGVIGTQVLEQLKGSGAAVHGADAQTRPGAFPGRHHARQGRPDG